VPVASTSRLSAIAPPSPDSTTRKRKATTQEQTSQVHPKTKKAKIEGKTKGKGRKRDPATADGLLKDEFARAGTTAVVAGNPASANDARGDLIRTTQRSPALAPIDLAVDDAVPITAQSLPTEAVAAPEKKKRRKAKLSREEPPSGGLPEADSSQHPNNPPTKKQKPRKKDVTQVENEAEASVGVRLAVMGTPVQLPVTESSHNGTTPLLIFFVVINTGPTAAEGADAALPEANGGI
jgi:hypothetical protein